MSQSLSSAAGLKCKCSKYYKIKNNFLFLFSNVDFGGWNSQMLVRIAFRGDPDQTASSEAV